ncbi:2-haloalkanoic acid dehalogenase [Rhodovibrio salinarum]|uniref:2-haloalkanoic acid dehalogenase n=1 Tax=Rhodovibrio salinarum TaxID=1087 RepID=A0A934QMK1_9PROT|nr:HAD-IA family hydrolase [Rhodovibrio salinarum]MBK1699155.1 2-haloalkanoic acid dehalogenase [Rhodovibrio salinarum]
MTFDVVGTLIDFETGIVEGLRAIGREHGVELDGETALSLYRAERYAPDAGRFPDDLARCYARIAPQLGLPSDDTLGARMVEAVAASPAFEDSAQALARLARSYRLVAMTNARRWALERFTQRLGDPFWFSVTVDETGTEKPDPAFFHHVLAKISEAGFQKEQILHVAQSQHHDIGVSRRLGLTNCWIERRQGKGGYGGTIAPESFTEPDYHFPSMRALADAADAAHRGG